MGISELCIRRPVFATVMSLFLLLIGVVAYDRLTVREYPNIDEPVVSVQTTYTGASAEIVETQVTQVLEGSIAGIAGIDTIESQSRSETSRITIRFHLDVDPDVAASDVRDRVSRVRRRLPDEVDEPTVSKVEADAQPVLFMSFTSDRMSPLEISDYVSRYVVDRLKNLTGVADVQIYGERLYAMRIWVDRDRLAAYDLTVQDVEAALSAQNVEIPSGRIESSDREFNVLSRTGLVTPQQFEDIVVKLADGYQVKMRDVARVELGAADERRSSKLNGQNAITVGVIKQATANPLDVSNAAQQMLPDLRNSLPEGMSAEVGYDSAVFIDRSIKAVFTTIAEAVVLVVLVIFFFLRSMRASIIPVVTIPVSLITTFALMYAMGFTINTLTLLAMVLAIGLVVDDAIVVLENVYRYVEEGMKPFEAAMKGSREIFFAVVAMTITLAAVYAPIAFAEGRTGRLFLEFALTLAGAVLISGFVAVTLTPMMCSKLLKHQDSHGRVYMLLERFFEGMTNGYRRLLRGALSMRFVVILFGVIVAGASGYFFTQLSSETAPVEDRGVLRVFGRGPEGATIGYTTRYADQAGKILAGIPEARFYTINSGSPEVTNMFGIFLLKDWEERTRKQQEIREEVQGDLRSIVGMDAFATNPPSLGGGGGLGGKPVNFVVQSSGTYEDLREIADRLVEALSGSALLENVESDLVLNKPELQLSIDRQKVADLGIDVSTAGRTLESLLGGRQVTRFERDGEQYDVIVQLAAEDRASPQTLSTIYLRSSKGEMIQLSNIVQVRESLAPRELRRFNQLRAATISANLAPGVTLGDALAEVEAQASNVLPATVQKDYSGQSREFLQSNQSIILVFVLAILFIYLVLAAQFESFVDPFIILLTVPLSLTGALAALYFAGGTLNIFSQIGLVTLVGLITKHGILIVEFANQQQEMGRERIEAVVEAAALRLRPILMTTGAMVLGAIPLALASGAGAESRQQIGWVIVGGVSLGTILTLLIVPVAYSFLGKRHEVSTPVDSLAAQPAE
ncbi:efflux RND transporter permease subunit [Terrihabitans sp. B22-R8]|uniref:efflux RND transporter permease subunit n=1 Tax=Terrihabitans sp. B22-R8 TaxID=3425128 RepID=UPI00403C0F7C